MAGLGDISDTFDRESGKQGDFDSRVRGVLEQTKADVAMGSADESHGLRGLLEQRLAEAGLELSPAEIDALEQQARETPHSERPTD